MITHSLGRWYTGEEEFSLEDSRCSKPLNEMAVWLYTGDFPDGISIQDVYKNIRAFRFFEMVGIHDPVQKVGTFHFSDAMTLQDKMGGHISKAIMEAIEAIEAYNRAFDKNLSYEIHVQEYRNSAYRGTYKENTGIIDIIRRTLSWERAFRESVDVSDQEWNTVMIPINEGISVGITGNRGFRKNLFETLDPVDPLHHTATFHLSFTEVMNVADHEYQQYRAAYKEVADLLDEMIHSVDGVLSEVIIREGEMSLSDFKDLSSSPVGYAPFVDFRVGDYEYKEALYRFTVEKKEMAVNMALHDLVVHVDIPDTNDRGRGSIPAKTTKIYYNKHYYNPPEVVVSVIGGSESAGVIIPYVLSTDKADSQGHYFEVVLKDLQNHIVQGQILWTAKGY